MKNILEFLEESTSNYGDKIAIIEEEKKISYKELLDNSMRIGSGLIKYTDTRKPIPVLMEKGIECVCTFLGSAYAGCFYSLLNPDLPATRLQSILNVLEAEIIVTDNEHMELANSIVSNQKVLNINKLREEEINENKLNEIKEQALENDPLYVNFTSGSTGTPKGVVVCHKTVIDFINRFTKTFNITEKDIIGNQAPFDFDVSVKDIYSSLKTGATLVIIPKKLFSRPVELIDYIDENNVTTLIWAVSALCLITTFHGLDYKTPKSVNKVMFSGEVMPLKHIKQWIEHLPDATFVNLYGPTEITCNCAYHIVDKSLNYEKQIPIGKAFENEMVFLLDKDNNEIIDTNVVGEICVKGTALALGYYNNKEQSDKAFVQNPLNKFYRDIIYKTGDLGYYDENGELNYSGRKDFQIKHMGHRIELEEIEKTLETFDNVSRACCVYNHEKSKLYCYYIGDIESKELKGMIKEKLPIFMIPNKLEQVNEFPMTKNGKIDRKKLCVN